MYALVFAKVYWGWLVLIFIQSRAITDGSSRRVCFSVAVGLLGFLEVFVHPRRGALEIEPPPLPAQA